MARAAGFPVMGRYGMPLLEFRNIKTLMGAFGFSDRSDGHSQEDVPRCRACAFGDAEPAVAGAAGLWRNPPT